MSNQDDITAIIKAISGQANVLTIPRVYVAFTKSHRAALFLSQCVYWSDRSHYEGGWFYKTYKDWKSELGLNQHAVETCVSNLVKGGWLETRLDKVGIRETRFYRSIMPAIVASVRATLAESTIAETANVPKRKTITSSIKHRLLTVGTSELLTIITNHLHQTLNGTYDLVQPVVSIDEHPNVIKIGVSVPQPALKAAIASLVGQYSNKKWQVRVVHVPATVSSSDVSEREAYRLPLKLAYERAKNGTYSWTREHDTDLDALLSKGCTPERIGEIYKSLKADPFWSEKVIPFSVIVNNYTTPRAVSQPAQPENCYV